MLVQLSAAALLVLAGICTAQVTISVSNQSLGLTESKSSQGERYTLSSSTSSHSVSLTCWITSTINLTTANITWRKVSDWSGASISSARTPVTTTVNKTDALSATSVLEIKYPLKSDIVAYMCSVNGTYYATGGFVTFPLLTMTVNGVNEYDTAPWSGENLAISCLVYGNPVGNIVWTKSVDPTFNVTNNDTIYMYAVSYDRDRGTVTCTSKNTEGTNSATMFLRIKNPNSYLAPLVATIVEIAVMLLVAAGYELWDKKRRSTQVVDGVKSD